MFFNKMTCSSGDVKPRKASDRNRGPKELVKKVLRQQNGNSRAPDFRADKLRIEEHPNEDEADEDRPKTLGPKKFPFQGQTNR